MKKNYYTPEEAYWCTGGNTGTLPDRITPSQVNVLEDGEVFVFGSNSQGAHMGGAARVAMEKFGAVWGQGEGLQGRSYAIPTMGGLGSLEEAVMRFKGFAEKHPGLKFFVTAIGCGIAGYKPERIAPFFFGAAHLRNVYLPLSFWKEILEMEKKLRTSWSSQPFERDATCMNELDDAVDAFHKGHTVNPRVSVDEVVLFISQAWKLVGQTFHDDGSEERTYVPLVVVQGEENVLMWSAEDIIGFIPQKGHAYRIRARRYKLLPKPMYSRYEFLERLSEWPIEAA